MRVELVERVAGVRLFLALLTTWMLVTLQSLQCGVMEQEFSCQAPWFPSTPLSDPSVIVLITAGLGFSFAVAVTIGLIVLSERTKDPAKIQRMYGFVALAYLWALFVVGALLFYRGGVVDTTSFAPYFDSPTGMLATLAALIALLMASIVALAERKDVLDLKQLARTGVLMLLLLSSLVSLGIQKKQVHFPDQHRELLGAPCPEIGCPDPSTCQSRMGLELAADRGGVLVASATTEIPATCEIACGSIMGPDCPHGFTCTNSRDGKGYVCR